MLRTEHHDVKSGRKSAWGVCDSTAAQPELRFGAVRLVRRTVSQNDPFPSGGSKRTSSVSARSPKPVTRTCSPSIVQRSSGSSDTAVPP